MSTALDLAQRLEAARQASGLTRQQLTRQAGVSRQALYRLFKGHDVQVSTLLAVTAVLQLDLVTVPRALQRGLPELGLDRALPPAPAVREAVATWPGAGDDVPSHKVADRPRKATGATPSTTPPVKRPKKSPRPAAQRTAPATPVAAPATSPPTAPAAPPGHAVSAVQRRLAGLKQAARKGGG